MSIENAYNEWAHQYDLDINLTRDLEAVALQKTLIQLPFKKCLELGCGTGKNTEWLVKKAEKVIAVDLSAGMLEKAKAKITSDSVQFRQADIKKPWNFGRNFDLITFSLILEHIENLESVFAEAAKALAPGGYIYIGELHPFKQYSGSKARFETTSGQQVLTCFIHHVSEFVQASRKHGLMVEGLSEYFDDQDRTTIPRILMLLLKKA
jgi:ubiquinone/menaquinone biosynthesis C-methylase UbiE